MISPSHWYNQHVCLKWQERVPEEKINYLSFPLCVNAYLGNSQLVLFGAFFRIRTGVVFTEGNSRIHSGLVNGMEGELGAEQVAHRPQGRAHGRGQRRVCQEVGNEAVSLAHHGNIHSDTGSWRLRHQTEGQSGGRGLNLKAQAKNWAFLAKWVEVTL